MGSIDWLPILDIPSKLKMSEAEVLLWADGAACVGYFSPVLAEWVSDDERVRPSHFAEINSPA